LCWHRGDYAERRKYKTEVSLSFENVISVVEQKDRKK